MEELSGRVAVITGSATGIGRGMALAFAEEGMHVVVADINMGPAEETAAEVRAKGVRGIVVRVDVSDRASVAALAERAYAEFGAVHLLCNNAGVIVSKPLMEITSEDWRWLLAVNVEGVVHGVRAFVPRMRAQGGPAHIVNTSSIAGAAPLDSRNLGAYSATKAAVLAYSEVLREELAPDGIGVSVLFPGRVPGTNLSNSELVRPQVFGGPRPVTPRQSAEVPRELPAGVTRWTMTPQEVARKVVLGVKANRAYIAADPERKAAPGGRFRRILDAFDASAEEDARARAAAG